MSSSTADSGSATHSWRVRVRGDAPFEVELAFPVSLDDLGSVTPGYTANRPVNAIPYVCAAPPGILTTADLPPIGPAGPAPAATSERPDVAPKAATEPVA